MAQLPFSTILENALLGSDNSAVDLHALAQTHAGMQLPLPVQTPAQLLNVIALWSAKSKGDLQLQQTQTVISDGAFPVNFAPFAPFWLLAEAAQSPELGYHICASLVNNGLELPTACLPRWAFWQYLWVGDKDIWMQAAGTRGFSLLATDPKYLAPRMNLPLRASLAQDLKRLAQVTEPTLQLIKVLLKFPGLLTDAAAEEILSFFEQHPPLTLEQSLQNFSFDMTQPRLYLPRLAHWFLLRMPENLFPTASVVAAPHLASLTKPIADRVSAYDFDPILLRREINLLKK